MSEARDFLKRNLADLMAKSPDLATQAALSKRSGISLGWINGLINDEPGEASEPRIDMVEKLAAAYGLAAWQLLHPNLAVSRREAELYSKMRELMNAERNGQQ